MGTGPRPLLQAPHPHLVHLTPPCIYDIILICVPFLWGHRATTATSARMTRQDFSFALPSCPHSCTDWLTVLWLRPSLFHLHLLLLLVPPLLLLLFISLLAHPPSPFLDIKDGISEKKRKEEGWEWKTERKERGSEERKVSRRDRKKEKGRKKRKKGEEGEWKSGLVKIINGRKFWKRLMRLKNKNLRKISFHSWVLSNINGEKQFTDLNLHFTYLIHSDPKPSQSSVHILNNHKVLCVFSTEPHQHGVHLSCQFPSLRLTAAWTASSLNTVGHVGWCNLPPSLRWWSWGSSCIAKWSVVRTHQIQY